MFHQVPTTETLVFIFIIYLLCFYIGLDPETQRYDIDVYLPNLLIECEYGVDGKLLLLPLKGSGPMTANVTDINAKVVLLGELYDDGGEKHIKFYNMTIDTKVGGGSGRLDNLFNGDKVLGDMVNQAINKNLDAFLKELLPVIDKNLAAVFMQIANSIVNPFSYDQLFPA